MAVKITLTYDHTNIQTRIYLYTPFPHPTDTQRGSLYVIIN